MEWITDRYPEIGQKCIVTIRMRNFNNQQVNLLTTATFRRNGFVTVNACRIGTVESQVECEVGELLLKLQEVLEVEHLVERTRTVEVGHHTVG